MHLHVARGFKLAADEASTKERALGAALGSGVSNLVTGTIAAPFLFASPERRFSLKALRKAPVSHLKNIYGMDALGKGLALSGVAMLGGAIRESVQAGYESRQKKANGDILAYYQELRRKARAGDPKARAALERRRAVEARREKRSAVGGGQYQNHGELLRVSAPVTAPIGVDKEPVRRRTRRVKKAEQFGIMVYQRDPGEIEESKRPNLPKTRLTRMFGSRMSGAHARHRHAERQGEDWMHENAEFVQVGRRPGLTDALRDVVGIERDQVLSRDDVARMVAERGQAKATAFERRRTKRRAKEHVHTHAPDDISEVMKTFEMLLENPSAKFFQVVGQ